MTYLVSYRGDPQAKQRPKFNRRTGAVYTPSKTTTFESTLKMLAMQEVEKRGGKPFEKACRVRILVTKKVPESWSKKRKEEYIEKHYPVLTKPDVDNIAKSVLDALNGVFYVDDKYVASLYVNKFYDSHDSVFVICSEIEEEDA